MTERLLSRLEVADFLGVPAKTLAAWASRGEGPAYYLVGKHARYSEAELRAWLESRRASGADRPRGRRPLRAVPAS